MDENLKKALDIVYEKMKGLFVKAVYENDTAYVFDVRKHDGSVPILGSIPGIIKKDLSWKALTPYNQDQFQNLKLVWKDQ